MSLRLRLALVVVGLVAVGLLVSDVAMYSALRSFLMVRVDEQLQAAVGPMSRVLMDPSLEGATPASDPGGTGSSGGPGAPSDQPPTGGPPPMLPPGTYGELRDAMGQVLQHVLFAYGDTSTSAPEIPAELPGPVVAEGQRRTFTVAGSGAGPDYRALAVTSGAGAGTVVVAVPLTEVSQTLRRLVLIELLVTAGVLVGLAVLSWWIVRRGLRPLDRMGETAAAIAAGDLSRRVEVTDPRTEVGRLGAALNSMLAQIERAFAERLASEERLRRFLADASHELRTPLTSIRGYAELFRRGARQRPEDLETSMRRIEQEASRMGVLVDDMLLLARLEQPRPLESGPVDLAAVAADTVQDARAIDTGRPIELVAPAPVIVAGDEDRLRQVVSNLLANALRHTPPGGPVEVAVQVDGATATLSVADRGPGLSPEEALRVFEPFYRSDPARSRDVGGAGLGLSIVAAIAAAHGGTAEALARPGGGALFRVVLPLRQDGDAAPASGGRRRQDSAP